MAAAEEQRDATKPASAQLRAVEQGVRRIEQQIKEKLEKNKRLAEQVDEAVKQQASNSTTIEELKVKLEEEKANMPRLNLDKQSDNLDMQDLVGDLGKWTEQLGQD